MQKYNKIKTNISGYSLIEIMVSVGIFSILLLSILSIAQSVSNGQKAAIASQNTQESLRFAFEVMSKEMRAASSTADKCNPSSPNSDNNEIFNIYKGGIIGNNQDVLYFRNKDNECVYYYLEDDADSISRLSIARDNDISDEINNKFYISPNDVKITNLQFKIIDNKIDDNYLTPNQVFLTLKMDAESAGSKFKQGFSIQTSVSSRHY